MLGKGTERSADCCRSGMQVVCWHSPHFLSAFMQDGTNERLLKVIGRGAQDVCDRFLPSFTSAGCRRYLRSHGLVNLPSSTGCKWSNRTSSCSSGTPSSFFSGWSRFKNSLAVSARFFDSSRSLFCFDRTWDRWNWVLVRAASGKLEFLLPANFKTARK